ncbi:Oidioi.mRNA.OKI2018_I69.PAR.g8646.t1.cds [Oikopleura dioica]|uniref:Oidioi.mRNA.OKI2018_I69.PAR.g8646.t1.cds n=1 Tax=Oikopleura dioica TaxID=34765 RepID=A0ABN7RKB4_OIKDI|nr:Oidioi.mRNA.OKI2018_I69.PAR.g8646.t1.cds [Oikopleura dioica]
MKLDPNSIISSNDVVPSNNVFPEHCGDTVEVNQATALHGMLIAAYIMLIVPFFPLVGAFLRRKESNHVWGSNLPGICSLVAGALYLAWYYTEIKPNELDEIEKFNKIFKAFNALSLTVTLFGALALIHLCFAFLGNILCSKFGSGDRLVGLFTFIFMTIVLAVLIAAPAAATALGWKYAFGACDHWLTGLTLLNKPEIDWSNLD